MFQKKESESIKEREKNYAVRDFFAKYDVALFKYPIKFMKFFIISLKRLINISNKLSFYVHLVLHNLNSNIKSAKIQLRKTRLEF